MTDPTLGWQRSSYCDTGTCVEVAWQRSSRCDAGQCVEVALGDVVAVRDSKNPDGPQLRFTSEQWSQFVAGVKAGNFQAGATTSPS